MMRTLTTTFRTFALGALLTLGAAALAQGHHGGGHGHGAAPSQSGGSAMGMGQGGAMGAGMAMSSHAADEAGFLVHMIPHHLEAVDSARALLEVTERPELRALAEAIVESQTAEIAAMEGWLEQWHPDVDRDLVYAPMMRDLGAGAQPGDVERAFLEDMVMHHMMAVRDARTLLLHGRAEHEDVATLARSIVADQLTEIDVMRSWLADWFDVTMPMGRMLEAAGIGMGDGPMGDGPMGDGPMAHGPIAHGMMQGGMGMAGGMTMGGMTMGGGMMGGADGTRMMGSGMHDGATSMGMCGGHRHHDATGVPIDAAAATRLAQAFLAGRGDGAVNDDVAPVLTYEVHFDDAQGGGVLIVDAGTGTVRLATER